jgi:hypothetical protein
MRSRPLHKRDPSDTRQTDKQWTDPRALCGCAFHAQSVPCEAVPIQENRNFNVYQYPLPAVML